jgi:hypothetical protein
MQNKNLKLLVNVLIIIIVFVGGYFFINKKTARDMCPFTLTQDDVFKVVLKDCTEMYLEDGTLLPEDYVAHTVEIQKIDGTVVQVFSSELSFNLNGADTLTARIFHDDTESYVILDRGTWTVRSFTIFSLKDGRTIVGPYMGGILTPNGYFVYTSADGMQNVHPEIDQSNATNIVSLRLSDFQSTLLYMGNAQVNYSVNVDPKLDNGLVTIIKSIWEGERTQFQISISGLEKKINKNTEEGVLPSTQPAAVRGFDHAVGGLWLFTVDYLTHNSQWVPGGEGKSGEFFLNENPKLRKLVVSSTVKIFVCGIADNGNTASYTGPIDEYVQKMQHSVAQNADGWAVYNLDVVPSKDWDGTIVAIYEQCLP